VPQVDWAISFSLVLVVGKDQVLAAAVDVEGLAQVLGAHGRAFDVPAGPPAPPGAVPAGLIFRRGFPQHEVGGVLLIGRHLHTRAGDHIVAIAPREPPVSGHRRHGEQHVTVGGVSVAAFEQAFDEGDHLRNVTGRPWLDRGLQCAKRRHVLVKGLGGARGQLVDRLAAFVRGVDDLVLHVGDVARVGDVVRPIDVAQQAVEHVEHHHRPGVADVRQVVDRRPAHIEAHVGRIDRLEDLFLARERVVEPDRQGFAQASDFSDGFAKTRRQW